MLCWMPAASVYFDDPDGHSLEFICMLDIAPAGAGSGIMVGVAEAGMSDEVRVEQREGWRKLTLNRPEKLNAANEAMLTALLRALDAAEADRACRALLLTGEGSGFCAGQEFGPAVMPGPGGPPDLGAVADTASSPSCAICARVPLPVVCAVNGVAAGAGASYALACDIVLAARSARFIQAFVKIGLVPDSGASFFLPRLIGEARARALAMLGETVDAERAADLGNDLEGRWMTPRCSRRPRR